MKALKLFLLPLLFMQVSQVLAEDAFPIRALFPKVETIELEALYNKRADVVIFDVRSTYEYETLHIKDARHLALDDKDFITTLSQLRKQDKRDLIFYCNGHTCQKSYKAADKARKAHIDRVYTFDAGIFEWTKAYPDDAVMLGKSPVNPGRLLDKEKLESHMLEPEAFGERVSDSAIVIDIRDDIQKSAINLFPMRQVSVPLDNQKLKVYVDKAKNEGKTLLIYDAVGKQVRWLQYYLEEEEVPSYFFMKGGAKAFLAY